MSVCDFQIWEYFELPKRQDVIRNSYMYHLGATQIQLGICEAGPFGPISPTDPSDCSK